MTVSDPGAGQQQGREVCELSQRVDGKWHSWRFDGDDPYVICHYCGRVQDALTGRVMDEGRNAAPSPTPPAREMCPPDADIPCTVPSCARCTPPARDSGRDEAREAVSRALASDPALFWGAVIGVDRAKLTEFWREVAGIAVDELLALPELDKLLRRPA